MSADETTLTNIEVCLQRLNAGDESAWNDLFSYAFQRLLIQCSRIVRQTLSRPNPMITENSVLAEASQRLQKAMRSEGVAPRSAREFFGLAALHIKWQVQDMLRKKAVATGGEEIPDGVAPGETPDVEIERKEMWECFWKAVDQLPEDQREVFDLLWVNGLSQYEAAKLLGIDRNKVDGKWRKIKIAIASACKDHDLSM